MYTNCQTSLSVGNWPPEGKDIQLLIRSCTSFLFGSQLSTDKLVSQFVYIFIVAFPVWAGIDFSSISCFGWNWFWFQPKQEMKLSTCVLTSFYLCQLITDLCRCRTYFLTSVCLFVVCLSSVFYMKYLSLWMFRIS